MGADGRVAVRPLRRQFAAGYLGQSRHRRWNRKLRDKPDRYDAELARRDRLQTAAVYQRLLRSRYVVQPVCRSAVAIPGESGTAAGEKPIFRGRQQMGRPRWQIEPVWRIVLHPKVQFTRT